MSAFVLISQNRQSSSSDQRSEQDFQTNIDGELPSELIADKLGTSVDEVAGLYRKRIKETETDVAA